MKPISEEEYQSLTSDVKSGKKSLHISRNIARQFYTRVSNQSVQETASQSAARDKSIVYAGLTLSPVLLLFCALIIIYNFGGWAAIVVPLVGIFWAVLAGLTSAEGSWQAASGALIISIIAAAFDPNEYTVPLALFVMSIWAHRLTYIFAQRQLLVLVATSYPAFDMLADHIEVAEPGS